jgi:phosphatidylserine/phosphatidylglycerophosphate/cardiolipin synthase-like enzyme
MRRAAGQAAAGDGIGGARCCDRNDPLADSFSTFPTGRTRRAAGKAESMSEPPLTRSRLWLAVGVVSFGLWAALAPAGTAAEPAGPPQLFPPPCPHGHALCLLDDDFAAAGARVELIESARCRIDLAVYAMKGDWFSYGVLGLLRDAARRGVEVHVVVDAFYNWVPGPVREHLAANGVQVREYHPWRSWGGRRYNYRLHDKLLLVDGRAMIVGGRNIAACYFGHAEGRNFRDRDVLIHGPAAGHCQVYFHQLWNSDDVSPDDRRGDLFSLITAERVDRDDVGRTLTENAGRLRAMYLGGCGSAGGTSCGFGCNGCIATGHVEFLHSDKSFQSGCPDITAVLLETVRRAGREVIIETPYPVFPDEWLDVLEQVRRRGVRVVLLTNSPHTTNHLCVHAAYVNRKRRLLKMGVELYEFGSGDSTQVFHTKSLVVDDIAVIPTHNFNHRSQNLDTEIAVVSYDPRVAAELRRRIFADIALARPVAPTEYPLDLPQWVRKPQSVRYPVMHVGRLFAPVMSRYY